MLTNKVDNFYEVQEWKSVLSHTEDLQYFPTTNISSLPELVEGK